MFKLLVPNVTELTVQDGIIRLMPNNVQVTN